MTRDYMNELRERMKQHTYLPNENGDRDIAVVVLTAQELEALLEMAEFYINVKEAGKKQ